MFQAGAKHKADQETVKRLVTEIEALHQGEDEDRDQNCHKTEHLIAEITAIGRLRAAHAKASVFESQKARANELHAEIAAVQQDIKDCMAGSWWVPLAKRIASKQEIASEQRRLVEDREQFAQQLKALRNSRDNGVCMTCHQPLVEHRLHRGADSRDGTCACTGTSRRSVCLGGLHHAFSEARI